MTQYRKKVVPTIEAIVITTPLNAKEGDYLVLNGNGAPTLFGKEEFEAEYEPVPLDPQV